MKSKILGILITLLFVAGYATLNYPVLGTLYNQIREGKVIDSYDYAVQMCIRDRVDATGITRIKVRFGSKIGQQFVLDHIELNANYRELSLIHI